MSDDTIGRIYGETYSDDEIEAALDEIHTEKEDYFMNQSAVEAEQMVQRIVKLEDILMKVTYLTTEMMQHLITLKEDRDNGND